MRPTFALLLAAALACANPFAPPEPTDDDAVEVDTDPPPPPPAPVDPEIPVRERVERLTTPVGDGERVSYLHLPSRTFGKPPLVVVLHGGREGDPRTFARRVDHWFDRGVAFAFPSARERPDRAKGKSGKRKGEVDEGKGARRRSDEDDDLAWKEPEDAAYVELVVEQLVANRGVDPERVFVVGFGAGGELAWKLACESRTFAGYGIVSAGLLRAEAETCPMPGFPARLAVLRSTEDPWLLWTGDETYVAATESMAMFGGHMRCDLTRTTDVTRDDLDPDDGARVTERSWSCPDGALRLYEIAGAGHGWPTRVGEEGRGEATRDIDTMDELAAFFGVPR
jgi:polyhydroxybutyrate depolymerase